MLFRKAALLTGATGFIGANVSRKLVDLGWEVHVVVRKNSSLTLLEGIKTNIHVHIYDGTIASLEVALRKARPEVVMHLASLFLAEHKQNDVERLISSNILFSTQLLEAMLTSGTKKLINTGTSWQHYEDADYNPVNLYAATKQCFEDIIAFYNNAHGLSVVTLVLFDTYGPCDPRGKLIPALLEAARTGKEVSLSEGFQKIDLVYIDDVVSAYINAIELVADFSCQNVRYGVCSGSGRTLREVIRAVEVTLNVTLSVNWGAKPYREREVFNPWSQSKPMPGWKPLVSLEVGLKRMLTP